MKSGENVMIYRYRTSVADALTEDVLAAPVLPDLSGYREEIQTDDLQFRPDVHVDLLKRLFVHAADLGLDPFETDAWLAPRLHFALRIPRRLASDPGFWSWVAVEYGRPYVQLRWGDKQNVQWRYTGPLTRNAISRLWWAAELTRNGPDYSVAPHSVRRAGTAQYAFELKYSWYRPAVIGFVIVAEGLDDGPQLSFEETKRLSTRINALTVLKPVEAVGFDALSGEDAWDFDWYQHRPSFDEVIKDELPRGPNDGRASAEAIDDLAAWFRALARLEAGAEDPIPTPRLQPA